MLRIYSYTQPIDTPLLDAYGVFENDFTDQFAYWSKDRSCRYVGLGRCIAVDSLSEIEFECDGPEDQAPIFFSFNRFDQHNPKPTDPLFAAFPKLRLMLPEVVLIENEDGRFLQLNSLGSLYEGRIERFVSKMAAAKPLSIRPVGFSLQMDSPDEWRRMVSDALVRIESGVLDKVVLARRLMIDASETFSASDLFVNLIEGSARGTVFLYRYNDVFFVGATPELLVRKKGERVESMCLAGTAPVGSTPEDRERFGAELLEDPKNRREHAYVVDYLREAFRRDCYDVQIADEPHLLALAHVQHLCTPVSGKVLKGETLQSLMYELYPTPALSGAPVGEAMMSIRELESFNRGLFGGTVGYVDGNGDGEFSVSIRSGVFDGQGGYVYAGCGIIEGSDADAEYDEIGLKLETILSAFASEPKEIRR